MNKLVRITECVNVKENGETIIPILYHVDPSDVQKQRGSFQEAFVNQEKQNEGCGYHGLWPRPPTNRFLQTPSHRA